MGCGDTLCDDTLCASTNPDHLSLLIHLCSLALKADAEFFLDFQEQIDLPLKLSLIHLIQQVISSLAAAFN